MESFFTATCAWGKIPLRLPVWNLCADGAQIMRAADCKHFVEKTGGFFDSIKRRKDFPCGVFLEDLWLVIWGRTEYDTNGESISPCEEK